MNQSEIGALIRDLRAQKGLTQRHIAQQLGVTEQAVSRWERGIGLPDPALIRDLAQALGVNADTLLSGRIAENDKDVGNMKKTKFYVCPVCGNILTSAADVQITCCGRSLAPLVPQKADAEDKLNVEIIEDEYYISSDHEMTRDHFVSFVALLTGDTLILRRLYPEWNLSARLPRL
ncbi:MAG: helix-turn-helix domain-containing protein, partial [Clostridia bacterium]|nr:helix-turn-helix domain-containing protein [Clostridia bacterium]